MLTETDLAPFRAWLRALRPGACAGYANTPLRDPLARFLRTRGALNPVVTWATFSYYPATDAPAQSVPLPAWASAFARALDTGRADGAPVTARAALAVLAQVTDVREVGNA